MNVHKAPFHWVRKIDSALYELDRIPLFGLAPHLDLSALSSAVQKALHISDFSIALGDAGWIHAGEMAKGVGPHPLILGISLSPLPRDALFLMSRRDVTKLTSSLLNREAKVQLDILQEGFYRYLALQALDLLQETAPMQSLTLQLNDEVRLHSQTAYYIDVELKLGERSSWGRLVLGTALMDALRNHFRSFAHPFSISPLAKGLELEIGLKTGSVMLTQKEWRDIKVGDFLSLDKGSYDPRKKEGVASLTLGRTPLFHVAVKENKIKLLGYALSYEEDMEMNPDTTSKDLDKPREEEVSPAAEGVAMAIKDLPLFVTVELARLRMTMDHLMKLAPGNFLELPIHPDQGVALTVNGQKIGRGELVYLGEKLGVRILETAEG
jgi:flagellar motor switch protein FliN/FliY